MVDRRLRIVDIGCYWNGRAGLERFGGRLRLGRGDVDFIAVSRVLLECIAVEKDEILTLRLSCNLAIERRKSPMPACAGPSYSTQSLVARNSRDLSTSLVSFAST
jgi:hypothetical protein